MNDLEMKIRTVLQEDASRVPPAGPMPDHVRPHVLRRRAMTVATASLTAFALIAGSVLAIRSFNRSAVMPAPPAPASPISKDWMLEDRPGTSQVFTTRLWEDPRDASVPWVDLTFLRSNGAQWHLGLALPPRDRTTEELFSYGLVIDTTKDGVPDYLVGIEDDPTPPADLLGVGHMEPLPRHVYRVWVTDLATGETDEQVGPPYGLPIEFSHHNEPGEGGEKSLWFLGSSFPGESDPRSRRFYAWASVTVDGEVVARDVAPDEGWMTVGNR